MDLRQIWDRFTEHLQQICGAFLVLLRRICGESGNRLNAHFQRLFSKHGAFLQINRKAAEFLGRPLSRIAAPLAKDLEKLLPQKIAPKKYVTNCKRSVNNDLLPVDTTSRSR